MAKLFTLIPSPDFTSFSQFFSISSLSDSQIDVLQAEVTALKTLVLTSTPSSPNRQLHPQLQSSGTRGGYKHVGGHVRNKSTSGAFPSSLGKPEPSSVSIQPVAKEEREVASVKFVLLPVFFFKYVCGPLDPHSGFWTLMSLSLSQVLLAVRFLFVLTSP